MNNLHYVYRDNFSWQKIMNTVPSKKIFFVLDEASEFDLNNIPFFDPQKHLTIFTRLLSQAPGKTGDELASTIQNQFESFSECDIDLHFLISQYAFSHPVLTKFDDIVNRIQLANCSSLKTIKIWTYAHYGPEIYRFHLLREFDSEV